MSATPVVLILGAGPRIGASVSARFASNGFKVALASRSGSGKKDENGYLSLKADFTNPDSIPPLFDAVKKEFQAPPNVVIYNTGSLTKPPDDNSVLSILHKDVTKDFIVNTVSPYVAAQQAIEGWKSLPKESKKTFIYTGNITNVAIVPMPLMLNVGMGKAASAYWIGVANALYAEQGYRFHYADERHPDGRLKGLELDGEAHGDFYAHLASQEENLPWHATFVKSKGYVKF
ncbi:3-oxoacyl-[acyl-carrier-protein] reductase FabG [Pseudocercospora fuligena]|uniref:3-oxoacyl-[acyl-carrier-protein] reductase FabG n=1 Tax=Pseudocercospora fuligena TaxID=685502 RepID=A0A8H6VGQ7_9PEZI|nr:3-oxoacyl-[acyl-carrier-protein] reductase FabG [Pseudocercospora fuligena]